MDLSLKLFNLNFFAGIRNLEIRFDTTNTNVRKIGEICNPQSEVFLNVNELKITDDSGYYNLLKRYFGIYKNCKNIKKIIFETLSIDFFEVLRETLPHFVELKEIHLSLEISNDIKKIIRENIVQDIVKVCSYDPNENQNGEVSIEITK